VSEFARLSPRDPARTWVSVISINYGGQECLPHPATSVETIAPFRSRAHLLWRRPLRFWPLGWTQALFKVKEAQRILATSHAGIYRDLAAGRLEAVKNGAATRITAQSLARRLIELPRAQARRT